MNEPEFDLFEFIVRYSYLKSICFMGRKNAKERRNMRRFCKRRNKKEAK